MTSFLSDAQARGIGTLTLDMRQIVGYCLRCGKPILIGTPWTWTQGVPTEGVLTDPYHTCDCWKARDAE